MNFTLTYQNFITLSPEIRDWVLIPLLIVTVCSNYLRTYINNYLGGDEKLTPRAQQEATILQKAQLFCERHFVLFSSTVKKLRTKFTDNDNGILMIQKAPTEDGVPNMPQMDPTSMLGGMKGNMVMMIIQIVLMTWIGNMFDGFLVLKMPFPLSYRFKLITQQGLGGMDLDVSYVSSMSWYILIFAGGRYIIRLFDLNDDVMDISASMGMAMPTGKTNPMAAITGVVSSFNSAAESINMIDHDDKCLMDTIEDDVMKDLGLVTETKAQNKLKRD
ncbi:hypothetical protein EHI8A_068740 [Entamoeba histolytica HM-1:IMSS-B]|uniref:ER membrane protein complex subunit 3 n=6 Tax=Entamoeba histolytica TaxID=5759 RepID=C4LSX6_ENTH1|nr:hypothetical protein, conserved [Entamoeba histolytica HM-1:IMSS]EMD49811.1 transmembrane protein, putative [Entamoeba histolytica KU27]EMH72854.1 hypothetical protein EHI8A_068740 [Entamoeba histolytica HM-1:IMSS-B]EMS17487.1 transmembrane protein [Entamoeba histolytica HM-3:IMSS]ENY60170.1 transmembrane protein, putative [Entamoeba histolytica HM-1:IMSS-A]GAT91644.1 hypothetical protein conserved [Entamoeba histolytica]|eukprot:XP_657536.1 hypothetical protein, conserved [Entamoeba histolytica HM-1:IMSS]